MIEIWFIPGWYWRVAHRRPYCCVLHKNNIDETEKKYGGEYTSSSTLPPLGITGSPVTPHPGKGDQYCGCQNNRWQPSCGDCPDNGCSSLPGNNVCVRWPTSGDDVGCYCTPAATPAPCSACLPPGHTSCGTVCTGGTCPSPKSTDRAACCDCGK